ncbi:zinc-binding dehydrogenase [Shimia sp. CNT1-13L.2]|uniref:quinone oxidoreductase family protein n=1 Tax=Shimia sp. CNT1-13L.2 TaxID=2959663 RepID=UPI0020CF2DAB|nr:zinc-binding dehydrogenase [Shimia sp. CNT1-13L.2]MCP9482876.1 zinc-binding dehydrogenase [Shimia sp. CNT1-13L.2]
MSYAISIPATGAHDVLERIDLETAQPDRGEVLVRNHAGAVNFIDTIIRRGEMPEGMMPALPHVPGVEGAGIVEAVGADVDGLAVGDRVAWIGPIGAGGYGSHSVIGASYVAAIGAEVAFTTAAAMPVNALTAWHMLVNLGRAEAGDSVLIHAAAGGVGTMAVQIAKYLGLEVIASVSTDKVAYARAQGADHVIDYRSEDIVARVAEITGGRGVDITLNPVSGESVKGDLESLAPLGTAVIFGFLAGPPQGSFEEDLARHFQKSIAVRVSDIYTYFGAKQTAFHADLQKVFDLLGEGVLRPTLTVLPLEEAGEAHRRLEAGETVGKLVLSIA